MNSKNLSRRQFLAAASAGTAAVVTAGQIPAFGDAGKKAGKLAVKGGKPVRTKAWPTWPIWEKEDEERIFAVLRSGVWSRAKVVSEFEEKYAEMMGVKRCLATTNGTHALIVSLKMLGIGIGDEVIVGPYTFIATSDSIPTLKRL
jgi:perosamine synthetase